MAEVVGARRFAWCSLDPITRQVAVYPQKQALLLESALRAGNPNATIMVQPANMDHGLVAIVSFNDPQAGEHTQRTLTGAGERQVRRIEMSAVTFGDGEEHQLPESAFVSFGRMAWVSVDPVTGALQPYSAENALVIEQRYHEQDRRASVVVNLADGTRLNVEVMFDFKHSNHTQSTGIGLRSVSRLASLDVPPEGVSIPLYRLPQNDTSDSLRYRLKATPDSESVGNITVPESVFMEESQLGVDAFSSVKLMENALMEMGYGISTLNEIASCMKEEPMRLAANVCLKEYQSNNEVALLTLIEEILREWEQNSILFRSPPRYMIMGAGVAEINGTFTYSCQHNDKPMYQQSSGDSIIYFEEYWKINSTKAVDNWCYALPEATQALPPAGVWAAHVGLDAASLEPLPTVAKQPQPQVLTDLSLIGSTEEFSSSIAALFTDWNRDQEDLVPMLCQSRGGHTKLMLRKVAASSLWRTIMQGA